MPPSFLDAFLDVAKFGFGSLFVIALWMWWLMDQSAKDQQHGE